MARVSVIVPWSHGCPHREAAFDYILRRWRRLSMPLEVGHPSGDTWCKAEAVTDALSRSDADILVIADADVWTPGVRKAIKKVESGAPWAIPHRTVYRLSRLSTKRVLSGSALDESLPTDEEPYVGIEGGGVVVLPRSTYLSVPLDPRFRGWGQEDESWALALRTLVGEPWRGADPLFHLWHPPQKRLNRRFGSHESRDLFNRYRLASGRPDMMSDLLTIPREEVRRGQRDASRPEREPTTPQRTCSRQNPAQ